MEPAPGSISRETPLLHKVMHPQKGKDKAETFGGSEEEDGGGEGIRNWEYGIRKRKQGNGDWARPADASRTGIRVFFALNRIYCDLVGIEAVDICHRQI